ncbi:hypothetical protein FACS1894176_00820 [Bacteroidia bacterium]|nr:hypothetical protein FACS1894176_00820 [Bacteroidia bacterium]
MGIKKNKKGREVFYATDDANGSTGVYDLSVGKTVALDYFTQKEKFQLAKEGRDEYQRAKQIPWQW